MQVTQCSENKSLAVVILRQTKATQSFLIRVERLGNVAQTHPGVPSPQQSLRLLADLAVLLCEPECGLLIEQRLLKIAQIKIGFADNATGPRFIFSIVTSAAKI